MQASPDLVNSSADVRGSFRGVWHCRDCRTDIAFPPGTPGHPEQELAGGPSSIRQNIWMMLESWKDILLWGKSYL
jgi:hypothetical protein